jgi:hypothetical protein
MTRPLCCLSLLIFISLCSSAALSASFDERLWEKYAEIDRSSAAIKDGLAGVYLEPQQLGDVTAKTPFSDLRVITGRKQEVPYQIVARRPAQRRKELPARMQNLSITVNGETWLELLIDRQDGRVGAVEIDTPDADFSRQAQILGSNDGKTWNTLRKDGVIFDINRGEKLRHTCIDFPQTNFRQLAVKIANGGAKPLNICGVKVLQDSEERGETYSIQGTTGSPESNASRQENSMVVRMNSVFPLDRLTIGTTDRNFQRSVLVQVKRGNDTWENWAQGTVFNFDTATMHESQLGIDMPEIATREFRLVFKNQDSPPISVTGVTGAGYRRLLVYKPQADQKLYLFWGNPRAQKPQYDLAGSVSKQDLDELPITRLGQARPNTKFAGNAARLPFSERYKYPLYLIVTLVIAGLIFLQYRVFRSVGEVE